MLGSVLETEGVAPCPALGVRSSVEFSNGLAQALEPAASGKPQIQGWYGPYGFARAAA